MDGLDFHSAALLLGLDPSVFHNRADIRNAYKARTAEISYEDSPEEFAEITRAYQLLVKGQRTARPQNTAGDFAFPEHLSNSDDDSVAPVNHSEDFSSFHAVDAQEAPSVEPENISIVDNPNTLDDYSDIFTEIDNYAHYAEMHSIDPEDNPAERFSTLLYRKDKKCDYGELLELAKRISFSPRAVRDLISEQRSNLSFLPHSYRLPAVHRTNEYYEFISYLYRLIGKNRSPSLLRVQDIFWFFWHFFWWGFAIAGIVNPDEPLHTRMAFIMVAFVFYPSKERLLRKGIVGLPSIAIRVAYLALFVLLASLWTSVISAVGLP